jgi:hypothetical protein
VEFHTDHTDCGAERDEQPSQCCSHCFADSGEGGFGILAAEATLCCMSQLTAEPTSRVRLPMFQGRCP